MYSIFEDKLWFNQIYIVNPKTITDVKERVIASQKYKEARYI